MYNIVLSRTMMIGELIRYVLPFLITCYVIYKIQAEFVEIFVRNSKVKKLILLLMAVVGIYSSIMIFFPWLSIRYLSYAVNTIVNFIILLFCYFLIMDALKLVGIKVHSKTTTKYTFAVIGALVAFGFINKNIIRTTEYTIETTKHVNLRIVFVSDVHIGISGNNRKFLQKMVKVINNINADLLLFGGDIIENATSEGVKSDDLLGSIKSKYGSYGVLGNHEYYTGEPHEVAKFLEEKCRIKMLLDETIQIGDNWLLIGREDFLKNYMSDEHRKSIGDITNNYSNKNLTIVLDHNPKNFDESVANNIDLQLSGHTHNGQFFPGTLRIKFFYEKPYGKLVKKNSTLIVSSGVGTSGIPMKLFSRPEVVIINLK